MDIKIVMEKLETQHGTYQQIRRCIQHPIKFDSI